MTTVKLLAVDNDVRTIAADAIVIGIERTDDGPALLPGTAAVDAAFDGQLAELLARLGASGKADEVVKLPTFGKLTANVVVAAGVGTVSEIVTPEQIRRASGVAARSLAGTKRAVSTLSAIDLRAAVEGSILGAYVFTDYRSDAGDPPLSTVDFVPPESGTTRQHRAVIKTATAIADAVCVARDLVNTPPNDLYPASFADRASTLATAAGVAVEVLDERALRKAGYGGVLGVGGGSSRPPRVVRLRHKGSKPKAKVALVGKGITFDTGGISLKPPADMDHMTSDMAGAAAVVASVVLAAKLKLPLDVIATVPMAENMPSGTAYRPGDVLRMYGGKTVEVLNTDAEGRLILADAIVRACEDEPDYLIDTATLTGAQLIALGSRNAGVMGTDEFRDRVAELGQRAGEGIWPMPLPDELREALDSKLADIANVAGNRWAGMLVAGVFLREFVAEDVQWAHIDVAGPAFNTGEPWGYTGSGGTGVPVRTIAAVLADIAENP